VYFGFQSVSLTKNFTSSSESVFANVFKACLASSVFLSLMMFIASSKNLAMLNQTFGTGSL